MSKIIDLEKNISINSANTINKLCKPLQDMFGIKFFRYLKLYKNGKRIVLSNVPDAIRYMYCIEDNWKNLWHDGNFPEFLKPGWHMWHVNRLLDGREIEEKIENDLIAIIDVKHGMTFVQESKNYYEIFSFDSLSEHVYQVDKKILIRFVYYFKEQARKIINIGESEVIILPPPLISTEEKDLNQFEDFFNNTQIHRYYLNGDSSEAYLTTKEAICLHWLMQGKSVEVIAILENNATKTIQRHIENIKVKFNCQKQAQIIKLLLDSGLSSEIFSSLIAQ